MSEELKDQHDETKQAEGREMNCPSLAEWGLFEARLLPEDKGREMLEHASACPECGALLSGMHVEMPEAETTVMLKSATPGWKKDMLRQIAERMEAERRSGGGRRFPVAWAAIAAGVVVAVGGGTWWVIRQSSPESALRLVAQAYTEQRTIDLRFPGAAYGVQRQERGGGDRSFLNSSSALLDSQARIKKALTSDPENVKWLLAQAEVDLLLRNYRPARTELEKAQSLAPESSDIKAALAMAWYEAAESGGDAPDYGKAAQLFSEVLQANPKDVSALFNRALVYERLQMPHEAQNDWEQLLKLEPGGGWAEEARSRLDDLRKKLNRRVPRGSRGEYAALEPGEPAVFDLLARAFFGEPAEEAASKKQLAALATELKERSKDWWLADLLDGLHNNARPALRRLLDAELDNRRGDPDAALREADAALSGFVNSGNVAGRERARYEMLYAWQRSSKPRECLNTGVQLTTASVNQRYPWLRAQAMLELTSCANMTSDFATADRWTANSIRVSELHLFPVLEMRSLAARAATLNRIGKWQDAWKVDLNGLKQFWEADFPPARAYQFYIDLSMSAESQRAWFIERALVEEAVLQIAQTDNVPVQAMVRSRLSELDVQLEDSKSARSQLLLAENLFSSAGTAPAQSLYRADAQISLAAAEAQDGDLSNALRRLDSATSELGGFGNRPEAIRYFRAVADVRERLGDHPRSERALQALVILAEDGLHSLAPGEDRLVWTHELDQGYRGLVRLMLDRGDVWGALDMWEWYRTADSRVAPPVHSAPDVDLDSLQQAKAPFTADWVRTRARGFRRATMITFVQLPKGIAVWTYDNRGGNYRWIPLSTARANLLVSRLADACADPASPIASTRERGESVYRAVLAPLVDRLEAGRTLLIDADGPLARVPFRALRTRDRVYFGDQFRIVLTAGIDGYREDPVTFNGASEMVAVGSPLLNPEATALFPPLPDALGEATDVAAMFPNHILITGVQATKAAAAQSLRRASIFHFAGHGLSSLESTGLLLADDHESGAWDADLWSARDIPASSETKCQLVVLSACATSSMSDWGESDPANLPRALVAAGVRQVVASRWAVDSVTTRSLMNRFYTRLRQGATAVAALSEASEFIRMRSGGEHPYYWAGFEVFGSL